MPCRSRTGGVQTPRHSPARRRWCRPPARRRCEDRRGISLKDDPLRLTADDVDEFRLVASVGAHEIELVRAAGNRDVVDWRVAEVAIADLDGAGFLAAANRQPAKCRRLDI